MRQVDSSIKRADSFNTSLDRAKSTSAPSWGVMKTSPMTEDLSYGTSQPMNHQGFNSTMTSSPKQEGRTEDLNMEPIISTGEDAAILATSEKNGTTKNPAQHLLQSGNAKPLSTASSLMIRRIVENESLLIWQAYDDWRQKFPRHERDEMLTVDQETDLESDGLDDESFATETLMADD